MISTALGPPPPARARVYIRVPESLFNSFHYYVGTYHQLNSLRRSCGHSTTIPSYKKHQSDQAEQQSLLKSVEKVGEDLTMSCTVYISARAHHSLALIRAWKCSRITFRSVLGPHEFPVEPEIKCRCQLPDGNFGQVNRKWVTSPFVLHKGRNPK